MSEQATPPPSSYAEDRSGGLQAFIITMIVLTVVSICLRFWSRGLNDLVHNGRAQSRFWWDDWFALAATPFILTQFGIELAMIKFGLGRHIWAIDQTQLPLFLKLLYSIYFIYDASLFILKTSALLFLSRIFPKRANSKLWNYALLATHIFNICWFLGIVFGTVFMCSPVEKGWNPMIEGTCGPTSALWIGSAVPSVLIDLFILILPVPKIWSLRLSLSRKIAVTVIFILGYCVIVVSLGRLVTLLSGDNGLDTDLTYASIPITLWVSAEAPVSMLCICLPAMLPLSRHIGRAFLQPLASKLSSLFSSVKSHDRGQFESVDEIPLPVHESNHSGMAYNLEPPATPEKVRTRSHGTDVSVGESGSYWAQAQADHTGRAYHDPMGSLPIRVDQTIDVTHRDGEVAGRK